MSIKVYTFAVKVSPEDARQAYIEIERGRQYYNAMIAELNRRVQEELPYLEEACYGLMPEGEAKGAFAKLIYRAIRRHARDVRAQMPASSTECYTGTYHAVQAAFDQATSSKRKGVWPGEPFRYRSAFDNAGAMVGVHIQGGKTTWGDILSGRTSLFEVEREPHKSNQWATVARIHTTRIKIAKNYTATVYPCLVTGGAKQRRLSEDAIITHAMLCRVHDFGNAPQCHVGPNGASARGKWVLRITVKTTEPAIGVAPNDREPVGISIGWAKQDNGDVLVAVTSRGQQLRIPAYAVRMADRNNELRSERDHLANVVRDYLPFEGHDRAPKSASGTASFIQRRGLTVRADVKDELAVMFLTFLEKETAMRCTNDHVRRRFLDIRKDHYRKFVHSLGGKQVFIEKIDIKALAEDRLEKGDIGATTRFIAGVNQLIALLQGIGAEMVPTCEDTRERLGDEREPTLANAKKILSIGLRGERFQKASRKTVRKYRRTRKFQDGASNASATA